MGRADSKYNRPGAERHEHTTRKRRTDAKGGRCRAGAEHERCRHAQVPSDRVAAKGRATAGGGGIDRHAAGFRLEITPPARAAGTASKPP